MIDKRKYGIVYTPDKLAAFVSRLLLEEYDNPSQNNIVILDPACGEGALLAAAKNVLGKNGIYYGIDIDPATIEKNISFYGHQMTFIHDDFILPSEAGRQESYWKKKLGKVDCIIANPPWSSERLYTKESLSRQGYSHIEGQYNNYVLFIEACLKLVRPGGICAFILPDSIFAEENTNVRKMLCEKTEICVIARLGEKIFTHINRAASILIVRKTPAAIHAVTKCFRLCTESRRKFLLDQLDLLEEYHSKRHFVKQARFSGHKKYLFDIDLSETDELLMQKIEKDKIKWENIFKFSRGVEISKSGMIVICPHCGSAQRIAKKNMNGIYKTCSHCGQLVNADQASIISIISNKKTSPQMKKIYVGENLHRYSLTGERFIQMNIPGIQYKDPSLYFLPKILIRKTGLGIDASIDQEGTYTSQTIFSLQYLHQDHEAPLEYYLALLNSRVVYYYYIKKYGENEWKSHPYLTKNIIYSLPVKAYKNTALSRDITLLAKKLLISYDRQTDLILESKIMHLYDLNDKDIARIKSHLETLPDLNAINNMKF